MAQPHLQSPAAGEAEVVIPQPRAESTPAPVPETLALVPTPAEPSDSATGVRGVLKRAVPKPARRLLWSLDDRGRVLQQRVFERRMQVSTAGHTYLDEGIDSENAFYEGCEWIPTRRVLKSLEPGPDDVFVDLGSGKGQALLIAGRLPYRTVLGIDLDPALVEAADQNVERARPKLRCQDVRSEARDVLQWEVPDDLTTVFMYCPFMGEVFHQAMQRIFDSYDRNPRPLHLVYDFPWMHDWLLSTGRVVVTDVLPSQWPAKPWWWRSSWVVVVYRVVGAGEGGPGVPDVRRRLFRPRKALERWGRANGHRFRLTRPGAESLTSS
jgi:SAM-dependent methyltransferase